MEIQHLVIYDFVDKKINKFEFTSQVNLFVSKGNIVGKSSLMKTLYYSLGYSIKIFPKGWEIDNKVVQVCILFNGTEYKITRLKNLFYIDEEKSPLTEMEYSVWLQNKIGINILSKEKMSEELKSVYASEVLLPFYVDQDKSWNGYIFKNSSDSYGRYSNIVKDVLEYYIGLSNADIIELEVKKANLSKEISTANRKLSSLILLESQQKYIATNQNKEIDIKCYQKQIEEHLNKFNEIGIVIAENNNKVFTIQKKIDTLKYDINELEKLAASYKEIQTEIKYECKHCNSKLTYEQSLTRLKIRNNLFEINHQVDIKQNELNKFENKLEFLINIKVENTNLYTRLKESLIELEKSANVNHYIELETNKRLAQNYLFTERIIKNEILTKTERKNEIAKSISDRKKTIKEKSIKSKTLFQQLKNKANLQLKEINLNAIEYFDFREIKSSGNDANQNILALYIIYFNIIVSHSNYILPFGMDSFIKNETSQKFKSAMFKYVENNLFSLNRQIFFSIIEENLNYLDSAIEYNIIFLEKPILEDVSHNNRDLVKWFDFLL